ncbi:MAG: DNA-directed RNA polymerase subunit beta, partial [Bdellovibrionales bacterium]|nr:DNA-directed RNA polymerase subunit beta [Bdellovibrionales bacterium]
MVDLEFDQKDLIYVRIDRRRKFPVTILLKALGYSIEQLLEYFYDLDKVVARKGKLFREIDIERMSGQRALVDIIEPKSGEVLVKQGRRITRAVVKRVRDLDLKEIEISMDDLEGKVIARPIIDESTGEIIADANQEMTKAIMERSIASGIEEFRLIFFDGLSVGPYLRNTLLVDKITTKEEALLEIY